MTEEEYYMDKQHAIADEQQREEWEATRAVVIAEPQALVRADVESVALAINEYRRVQAALDAAMPDCIQMIQRKPFRKKKYWRGVATAFNLTVELRNETLDQTPEGAWGYIVVYRATAPNGRFADGDGACYASEKASGQDTVHNVRGHAHTRAYNRAVSNLVGFGEVSAEEVQYESAGRGELPSAQGAQSALSGASGARPAVASPRPAYQSNPRPANMPPHKISDPQRKRLWALWRKRLSTACPDITDDEAKRELTIIVKRIAGVEHSKDIDTLHYDAVVREAEQWSPGQSEPETAPDDPNWGKE